MRFNFTKELLIRLVTYIKKPQIKLFEVYVFE